MGWAKYKEDNDEIIIDRNIGRNFDYTVDKKKEPPIYVCSYCEACFLSKEELYNHIRNKHNKVESIVFLNGKVIKPSCISYAKKIDSIRLIVYNTNLNITVNQQNILCGDNEVDLLDYLGDFGSNRYEILIGKYSWVIELVSAEEIDYKKIGLTTSKWDEMAVKGEKPNKNYLVKYNDLEKGCLDGFYNYYIACNAIGVEKKDRYEEAYSILNQYVQFVPLARVLLKIISFKFNWIEKLKMLCTDSDLFVNIINFYDNQESDNMVKELCDKKVFVEDDIEDSIQSIVDYQKDNITGVDEYLSRYSRDVLLNMDNDKNLRDRILLLWARVNIRKKEYHKARRCYDEIQTIYFQKEYKKFLEEME